MDGWCGMAQEFKKKLRGDTNLMARVGGYIHQPPPPPLSFALYYYIHIIT